MLLLLLLECRLCCVMVPLCSGTIAIRCHYVAVPVQYGTSAVPVIPVHMVPLHYGTIVAVPLCYGTIVFTCVTVPLRSDTIAFRHHCIMVSVQMVPLYYGTGELRCKLGEVRVLPQALITTKSGIIPSLQWCVVLLGDPAT